MTNALAHAIQHALKHWRWALFIGAANLFSNGTPLANSMVEVNVPSALVYNVLQFGFPLLAALHLADRAVDAQRLAAPLAYGTAVLATVLLGVWVVGKALTPYLGVVSWWSWRADIGLAATSTVWLGLGVAVYARLRQRRRAQARLQAAELAHAERQRELAAAQLLALQARVDPDLLFACLQRISTELDEQPLRAQARLDALIALLRALQPHAEARISTLGRELQAVQAFARLVSQDAQHTERLHLHLDEGLTERPFAPFVLLPLVRGLLQAPGTIWSLDLRGRSDGGTRIQVDALGPDEDSTHRAATALERPALAERLRAVHGPAARLQLDPTPLPRLTLDLPPWPAS